MRRLLFVFLLACDASNDHRTAEIATAISSGDLPVARTRPALVAGKYAVMAATPIDYYRGSSAVYAHDFRAQGDTIGASSRYAVVQPLVLGIGDAHPENFGALRASDGTYAIEPNDFDAADLVPYLYDLRRLLAGLVFVSHAANTTDAMQRAQVESQRRDVARRAALAYAQAMIVGGPRVRLDAPSGAILVDVLSRSKRDWGTELPLLTNLVGTTRTLERGFYDPSSPEDEMRELPAFALDSLPDALSAYRSTLENPPAPEFFTVLDAARKMASGVASFPRVRAYVLVRGPSDDPSDDVVLELKELADSNSAGFYPPNRYYDDVTERVRETSRALWFRRDAAPLWGTAPSWVGFPVQVRIESEGQKTVRVSRMEGARGTYESIAQLGEDLARIVARCHATPSRASADPASFIAAAMIDDPNAFADEQADVAVDYGDRSFADLDRFKDALSKYGPTLGVPVDPADMASADLRALYDGAR